MALQSLAVSGSKKKRNQIAELNARQQLLPQIIANKNRAEDIGRQESAQAAQRSQWDRNYRLQIEQGRAREEAARAGMGLEAAKLGTTLYSKFGDKTIGNTFGVGGGSTFGDFSLGGSGGGALVGYGLGTAFGGKKKGIKYLGAGLGALAGGFGGSIAKGIGTLFR